jgi:hypothetical protein
VQIIGPKLLDKGYKASFLMLNIGPTAAKHIRLTIKTPSKINTYSNFSTENMSLTVNKTSGTIIGKLPRFAQGEGSYATINLTLVPNPKVPSLNESDYNATATYDQGSVNKVISLPPHLQLLVIFQLIPQVIILVILGYGGAIVSIYYFINRWRKQKQGRQEKERAERAVEWERAETETETKLHKEILLSYDSRDPLTTLSAAAEQVLAEYAKGVIDADLKNNLIATIYSRLDQLRPATPG